MGFRLGLLVLLALVLAGCGGDEREEATKVVTDFYAAVEAGDAEEACDLVAGEALANYGGRGQCVKTISELEPESVSRSGDQAVSAEEERVRSVLLAVYAALRRQVEAGYPTGEDLERRVTEALPGVEVEVGDAATAAESPLRAGGGTVVVGEESSADELVLYAATPHRSVVRLTSPVDAAVSLETVKEADAEAEIPLVDVRSVEGGEGRWRVVFSAAGGGEQAVTVERVEGDLRITSFLGTS